MGNAVHTFRNNGYLIVEYAAENAVPEYPKEASFFGQQAKHDAAE